MNLSLLIALRYLLGKKSTNAINIITWVSIVGMSIGTAALLLILSVFNGFESLLSNMLSHFNPDIKITLYEGKFMDIDNFPTDKIKAIAGIEHFSFTIEETAFFDYNASQEVGIIKGIDSNFIKVTQIDTALLKGSVRLGESINYGVLGSGMNTKLSIHPMDEFTPVVAYVPTRQRKSPLAKDFNSTSFYPSGIFAVSSDIDMQYVLIDFDEVNALLDLENHATAVEIKTQKGSNDKKIIKSIEAILGDKFKVQNRYQQDENFLRIMNIEKWISYLIACLTMLIIAFNLVGSLWMLILEKKKDISILKSMGYTDDGIQGLFMSLGMLICFIGLFFGFVIALALFFLQKNHGLIAIPSGFLIDAYPVELRMIDFVVVIITVGIVGLGAAYLPSLRTKYISAYTRQE